MNKQVFAILMTASFFLSIFFIYGENEDTVEEPELSDWEVFYVQSGSDLPACGSETLGRLYYVADTAAFEVCTINGWSFVDLTGPAGNDGAPGADGQDVDPVLVAQLQSDNAAMAQEISDLEAELLEATSCQLIPYGNCPGADLRGMNLTGMDLTGINLRGADLQNTTFDYATLDGADLRSTYASNATFIGTGMNRTFLQKAEFNRFSTDCTTGRSFSGGYCGPAILTNSDLQYADLTDANLAYADLTDANLNNADLNDAILSHADLTDAFLFRADLNDAILSHADLTDANLKEADLTNAILYSADLKDADLRFADLTDARLEFANLTGASLNAADLTDAFLNGADLTGAYLQHADLKFADFRNAIISGGTSFTNTYWHQTEWTDGVRYDSNQA